jgi:hypothetical protein
MGLVNRSHNVHLHADMRLKEKALSHTEPLGVKPTRYRPAVLMPVGLLAGLPADQIEAILLHELAHISPGPNFTESPWDPQGVSCWALLDQPTDLSVNFWVSGSFLSAFCAARCPSKYAGFR